MECLII